MHELGLVNYTVKEVSKIAEANNVRKIKSVTLEFGEVSGIVTSYLYDYWKWYSKKYPMFEDSTLYCEEIPAVTWCDDCKITYSTVAYGKKANILRMRLRDYLWDGEFLYRLGAEVEQTKGD